MDDLSPPIWAVNILFFILSWLAVMLRVYVRAFMIRSFGADDWFMVATLLFFTGYLACQVGGLLHGTGKHFWDLTDENRHTALGYWFFCELFYIVTAVLLKISLGIFLLRVTLNRIHIWIIRFLIASTVVFSAMYFFLALFQCRPVSDWWVIGPEASTCIDTRYMVGATYTAGVLVSIADWTYGILPAFIVWDLQMKKKHKLLVAGILAFAAIGCIATVIRIPYAHTLGDTADFLYATYGVALWSTVECGIGITAGCMATLRPLLQAILWRAGLSTTEPGNSNMNASSYALRDRRAGSRALTPRPFANDGNTHGPKNVTTTVTGGNPRKGPEVSASDSQEELTNSRSQDDLRGINKRLDFSYEESAIGFETDSQGEHHPAGR